MTGILVALGLIALAGGGALLLGRIIHNADRAEDPDAGPRHSIARPPEQFPVSYSPFEDWTRARLAPSYYREYAPTFYAEAVA